MPKITALTELTSGNLVDGDQVALVDVSDTTQAASGSTKRSLLSSLKAYIGASLGMTGTPTAPTAAAGTNTTQVATTAHVFAERSNAATLTNKTLTSPTINGIVTAAGAQVQSANGMAALEIAVTAAVNTKSVSADSTLTFSATPATDTWFQLIITNTDTSPHTITIPSSYSFAQQQSITTFVVGASSKVAITWRRTATGYDMFGETGVLSTFSATAAPGVNDDVTLGFGAGSLWLDATNNNFYVCESGADGAAVWHRLVVAGAVTTSGLTMATARLLGRSTASTGAVEEITVGSGLSLSGGALSATGGSGSAFSVFDGHSGLDIVNGRGTTFTTVGIGAPITISGTTASIPAVDFNGDDGYPNRARFTVTTPAANSSTGRHDPIASGLIAPGASTRARPVKAKWIWANADAATGARGGVGCAANAGAPSATVEPSTFVNAIFMGYDTGDSQYSIYHNDGSGTCTKIALNGGTGFPCNDNATKMFTFSFVFYPGAGDTRRIEWEAVNITDDITVTGTIVASATGGIPADNAVMQGFRYRNSSANSTTAVAIEIGPQAYGGFSGL